KRLEYLHELVPAATDIGLLINPNNLNSESLSRNLQAAARTLGVTLHVQRASNDRDLDAAFAAVAKLRVGGLGVGTDPFFNIRMERLGARALKPGLPTFSKAGELGGGGGLRAYGGNRKESSRIRGGYRARILGGENPADLPVQRSTKIEFFIN